MSNTQSNGLIEGWTAARIARVALFAALAVLMGYVESLIPLPIAIPGIKLGIANVVIVAAMYLFSFRDAAIIALIRVLLVAFLFGNMTSMVYSLTGMAAAMLVMGLLFRSGRFSIFGVSIGGGAAHGVGQIFAAMALTGSAVLVSYLPILLVAGALCGLLIGFLSERIVCLLYPYC